jgi:hypothetical protein
MSRALANSRTLLRFPIALLKFRNPASQVSFQVAQRVSIAANFTEIGLPGVYLEKCSWAAQATSSLSLSAALIDGKR